MASTEPAIAMTADRVAIAPVEQERTSAFELPEVLKPHTLIEGIVLSIGPRVREALQEGQRVVFPALAAEALELEDEQRILVLCAADIVAVKA